MARKTKYKTDGVHIKLFINRRGETLLCRGRLMFLETIHKMGSISSAAKKMGYSYRKAWSLVEKTNRAAGCVIIETHSGGADGGGAFLTADGIRLVELFKRFLDENSKMADNLWDEFMKEFPGEQL